MEDLTRMSVPRSFMLGADSAKKSALLFAWLGSGLILGVFYAVGQVAGFYHGWLGWSVNPGQWLVYFGCD